MAKMDYWAQNAGWDRRAEKDKTKDLYGGMRIQLTTESKEMKDLLGLLKIAAETDSTALICGEKGTGKEQMARYIHVHSKRKNRPFLMVSCPALLPEWMEKTLFGYGTGENRQAGIFECADQGTIFLNKVEELSLQMQSSLLRILEEGQRHCANVRILAATEANLKELVDSGKFREELYYLLNIIPIFIPPVRNRKEDIIPICQSCLECLNLKYGTKKFLTKGAQAALQSYQWPGNVREIRNVVERAFVLAHFDAITVGDLPPAIWAEQDERSSETKMEGLDFSEFIRQPYKEALRNFERLYLSEVLRRFHGNMTQTAKAMCISRSDLYYKIQVHFPEHTKDGPGKE